MVLLLLNFYIQLPIPRKLLDCKPLDNFYLVHGPRPYVDLGERGCDHGENVIDLEQVARLIQVALNRFTI